MQLKPFHKTASTNFIYFSHPMPYFGTTLLFPPWQSNSKYHEDLINLSNVIPEHAYA